MTTSITELVDDIVAAENSHDPDEVAACVAESYRSETPLHPERDFTGREQVRRNWAALFESVPDLSADLERWTYDEDDRTLWTEWHLQGTQTDEAEFDARGVAIWGVDDGLLQWGRVYLEQVEKGADVTWEELYSPEE